MDSARPVWEGRIGGSPLRVTVLPSARIEAVWRPKTGNERRIVVSSMEELERSVLFQLMITATPEEQSYTGDIAQAIAQARVGMPEPSSAPRTQKPKRRKGGAQQQRKRRGGARRF